VSSVHPSLDPAAEALALKFAGERARIVPLAGDASGKRFFRVRGRQRSAVLMINPEPLVASSPLLTNHRILEAIRAPVPRILAKNDAAGLVLYQDFGDLTLQRRLAPARGRGRRSGSHQLGVWRRDYRQACDLIVLLQTQGARAMREDDFAARNALDRERFLFELDHFHRHFILGLRGLQLSEADEALLRVFYADLADACDALPRVYCHRDFMSRNLMLTRGRLGLIDYQDARMGPYTYDPASLLRDSSLPLEEGFVEEMVEYLAGRLGHGSEEFRLDFDTVGLERNIKELGTFGYLATERGMKVYLEFVPRAAGSVRRTMRRYPRYDRIYSVFDRILPPETA
jgi:aminoglycoside/choline kinase family phosphotransferase